MNKSHYDRATKIFEKIAKLDPTFKKNIYLLIGIAYKKQNQIDSSIKIVTRRLVIVNSRVGTFCRLFRLSGQPRKALFENR